MSMLSTLKTITNKISLPTLTKPAIPTSKSQAIINNNKVSVEWLTKVYGLSQIYSSGLEFCFISKDMKQACAFMFCKDFLQDALMATHNKSKINIYGFSYDSKKDNPIDLDRTRIAVTNSKDNDFASKIPAMMDFIHQFERKLKLIRSSCYAVENPPTKYAKCGVFIIEGSNRWMRSPPMISLYSLLIRVGFTHKIGNTIEKTMDDLIKGKSKPYQNNDKSQLQGAKTGIDTILKYGYAKVFFNDPKMNFPNIPEHNMHYNMGIVAYSGGMSKQHIKHWHRDLNKKPKKKAENTTEIVK